MTDRVIGPVVVEADGGSRGNPGPAAYGAVLRDAGTGAVIAEDGSRIGVATNNVAEYSGLLAGLRLAAEHAPGAAVEVRLDSKLVVEQMSGRWQVKNADLRALRDEALQLAPEGTTYTWVPRAENKHADRLVNDALDGKRSGVTVAGAPEPEGEPSPPPQGWGPPGTPTTVVLVRHGVTEHTVGKRFSGGLASANPGLSDEGRDQIRAVGDWLAPIAEKVDAVVASPVRRTLESAEILGALLDREVEVEPGFAEMEFGAWDGLTFAEVGERHPDDLKAWLGSLDVAPGGGGESFRVVETRVLEALAQVLERHAGKTVVLVSHVTPIKTIVAHALDAPLESVFRMELTPASITVVSWYDDRPSMRMFNALPPGNDVFSAGGTKW